MGQGINWIGANCVINPPPGDEGTVSELALFRSRGGANVACIELDDQELEDVRNSGRVFAAVFSGHTFFPIFVGSERTVQMMVADTGPTFPRDDTHAAKVRRSAIRFTLAPEVVALARTQGAGIELEVDGLDHIKAHVVRGEVDGNVPIAMPIDVENVVRLVREVREYLDEPRPKVDDVVAVANDYRDGLFMHHELRGNMLEKMMQPNTCGVNDCLAELEAWLDSCGVDVAARCYPPASAVADDFTEFLTSDALLDTDEIGKVRADMLTLGTGALLDGKRIDPRDFDNRS